MSGVALRLHATPRRAPAEPARPFALSVWWLLGVCAAILYGSLLPFDTSFIAFLQALSPFRLLWSGAPLEDVVTNIVVYIPVGLTVVVCRRATRLGGFRRLLAAVAIGGCLSLLAESLQTGLSSRVGSWTDVALNAAGAVLGGILGLSIVPCIWHQCDRYRAMLDEQPFTLLASVLTVGLVIFAVVPFDFVCTTGDLHTSFSRARCTLTAAHPVPFDAPPLFAMMGHWRGAVWFAVAGFCLVMSALERAVSDNGTLRAGSPAPFLQDLARLRTSSVALAIQQGVVLAAVVELLHLFTRSNQFELAALLLRSMAVSFGAWAAMTLCPDGGRPDQAGRMGSPPAMIFLAVVLGIFQIVSLLLGAMPAHPVSLPAVNWTTMNVLPFEALWRGRMSEAADWIVSTIITYGVLAVTLTFLARGARSRFVRIGIVAGVTVLACTTELVRASGSTTPPDVTTPVVACLAGILAILLAAAVPARQAASPLPVSPPVYA